jgi:putative tricarboxylic transport membrane protein
MSTQRVWMALPYAVLLAVAAWFYNVAVNIQYAHRPGTLGPDFWPRILLLALMLICTVQVGRLLLFGAPADKGFIEEMEDEEDTGPRSNLLLGLGMVLTVAYGALVTTLGFLIATFLFLVLFMYVGRYRAHPAIWVSSAAGILALTLLFQKVVYVSLPRGVPPFDRITDLALSLF